MAQALPDLAPLAALAIDTAVQLRSGQDLVITAPLEAAPLVRRLAGRAYERGARAVTCVYEDPRLIRERLVAGSDAALDHAAPWPARSVSEAVRAGAVLLRVLGPYPDLLEGIAPERIVRAHAAAAHVAGTQGEAALPAAVTGSAVPFVTEAWALHVFPALPPGEACARLWQVLFDAMRLNTPAPQQAWRRHLEALAARRDDLQARGFVALRVRDAATDLRLGLAPGQSWRGAMQRAPDGAQILPGLPCEELCAVLDGCTAEGHVKFSRPLALGGTLVHGLRAEFRNGLATQVAADSGAAQVAALFDAGATRRLHAIGLVPASSCLARQGTLFCSPLLDRQAASHLGFGPEQGLRIECMFGTSTTEVDGLGPDGRSTPLMRAGEFVS